MQKLFKVNFPGLWLGGIAIVRAETHLDALDKVIKHYKYTGDPVDKCTVEAISDDEDVVYIDNGDY